MRLWPSMSGWKDFLDSLDTSGGHIFLMFLLFLLGVLVLSGLGIAEGRDVIVASVAGILTTLKGTRRANGK